MSLAVAKDLVVKILYRITDNTGKVLDGSKNSKPMSFLYGKGKVIPGLEKALLGKKAGNSVRVKLKPGDGYGNVKPELIQTLDKSLFKEVSSLKAGMSFQTKATDGATQRIVVKKVEKDKVTIDTNHPLAGIPLNLDVKVVSVREPTKEELASGIIK